MPSSRPASSTYATWNNASTICNRITIRPDLLHPLHAKPSLRTWTRTRRCPKLKRKLKVKPRTTTTPPLPRQHPRFQHRHKRRWNKPTRSLPSPRSLT